jgi:DnaJ-class molecular chaperone
MFEADFVRPPIPILFVNINIELSNVFHPISQNVTYFKRKICAICNGNGGLNGACRQCTLCNGSGIAKHYFSHIGNKFDSITETSCLGCLG